MKAVTAQLSADLLALETERDRLSATIAAFREVLRFYEAKPLAEAAAAEPELYLTDVIWQVLRDEGHPLHYTEVYRRVTAHGVRVRGADPAKNVGAHLSRDPRIENVAKGTWALKAWRKAVAR
jgi:hypothetical protein